MEVHVRNLHEGATEKQTKQYFRPILARLNIHVFHCQKPRNKGFAKITIADRTLAQKFLDLHGQPKPGRDGFNLVKQKLFQHGRPVNCTQSYNPPDDFLLKSLIRERKEKLLAGRLGPLNPSATRHQPLQRVFSGHLVAVGSMDYEGDDLVIVDHYRLGGACQMRFLRRSVLVEFITQPADPIRQIEMSYNSIESLLIGSSAHPYLTFCLAEAPRCFEKTKPAGDEVLQLLGMLALHSRKNILNAPKRRRTTAVDAAHQALVGSCLCYSFRVKPEEIRAITSLQRLPGYPNVVPWHVEYATKLPFTQQMTNLNTALSAERYQEFSFEVKFQLQRLAQNGYLPPYKVLQLMQAMKGTFADADQMMLATALRRFSNQIPYAGPGVDASELSKATLLELLVETHDHVLREKEYAVDIAQQYEHLAAIHKIIVTPAGVYLYGPEPEVKNRVLRQYSAFSSNFLQVTFSDEDGEPVRYDRSSSLETIYNERFKKVLGSSLTICGRPYEFLGFSHSSLRAQTCWFMAPFIWNGDIRFARAVIKDLGNFSAIRSPAKCAARIGQAFSQAFSSVNIPRESFCVLPDVERLDSAGTRRVFSDGVGTCSKSILEKIWAAYAQSRAWKPTLCQIRYAGAKGMISLDSRLHGDVLRLRPSMIKFEATSTQIEICGAGFKPLPFFLNRQLIKILEDLGVPPNAFLDLQEKAVEQLRITVSNPINAGYYLQRELVGKSARIPWLIRKLFYIGMTFSEDQFLRDTHELAVLVRLRELKYRSRIFVERGITVYGIMDETGHLKEGEIYCSVHEEKGGKVLTGCPALHPGDVQYVSAIDVPEDSPLRSVHNCVVFSSKGDRDLPSQLSGGDLDGDLYNIIFDDSLMPTMMSKPADYPIMPPIDIGREVVRSDMTEFFVQFMENDQLGRLSTLHQTLADQRPAGVFDPDCIRLAEMCSTAVDFSKTGIPVDLNGMPKSSNVRPDFQAPGPRVLIENAIKIEDIDAEDEEEDDEDPEESAPSTKYYESPKVLGRLYRAIDEQDFFTAIQRQSQASTSQQHTSLAVRVWDYVKHKAALIQYQHYLDFAREVKDAYEDNMCSTMREYSSHPIHFASEVEVFAGTLIGKNGAQSKRQREFSKSMKDKHDRDVAYTVQCILQGEEQEFSKEEALARSMACLDVAVHERRTFKRFGRLVSFTWVAAAVCLKEVEKFVGI
ncbi:MAG: hypothetical protein LQ345_004646 [Seirophora villosa]|nr:MAG: hypothetical protein LQ345_004646 [Seirophora villosa]